MASPTRAAVAANLALALACWGLARAAAGQTSLPRPRLEDLGAAERELLEQQRAELDAALAATPTASGDLAPLFGELGRRYLQYGFDGAAEAALARAAALDPGELRWPYFSGLLFERSRRFDLAAESFSRALEIAPGNLAATLHLGEVELQRNRPRAARELFEAARADEDGRAAALYGLGRAAYAERDWTGAVTHLEAALEANPEADAVHHLLGLSHRELGDLERARRHLESAGRRTPGYPDPLALELEREHVGVVLQRATRAARAGDLEDALALYRLARDEEPDNVTYRQLLAGVLLRLDRLEEAEMELGEALRADPGNAQTHYELGLAYERGGRSEEAIAALERAVELDAGLRAARLRLAAALAKAERPAEAVAHYDAVLELDPHQTTALLGRARALTSLGSAERAAADLETLLASEPGHVDAGLDLAALLARDGRLEEAVGVLENVLEPGAGHPRAALVHFNLASLQQQLGRTAAAIEGYRRAIEAAPRLKDAHFNLATALVGEGRLEEAARSYARVVELDPVDVEARLGGAGALARLGRFAEARRYLDEGLVSGDGDLRLRDGLARLLAARPDPAPEDAASALEIAVDLYRDRPTPLHAETLAMALAASGRQAEAIEWQRRLITATAEAGGPPGVLERLRRNLARYEEGGRAAAPW